MKLSIYFLSLCTVAILCIGCDQQDDIVYKRAYSDDERMALSESLLNGAGTDLYYQGSIGERMLIHEGNRYNPDNAWGQRELGVPYLKRGFAHEASQYYQAAIKADSAEWLGYKAYCWLYFYRDYETALRELDEFDAFTPNEVDYPQALSVDYMRGVCYLHLGRHDEAIASFERQLAKEEVELGKNFVEVMPYQLLGISYYEKNEYDKAKQAFRKGMKYNDNTADIHYYYAKTLKAMGNNAEAIRELNKAEQLLKMGNGNHRPYVTEFYAVFQEDIDALRYEWTIKD